MKLKKNELKIIQLLLASPDYISTYDIATSTGIPRRLVRDEISNVRVILSSLNLNLLSKPSKGYFIEGKSSKDLSRLQNIINDNERDENNVFPTLPKDRRNYIAKRLIEEASYIKLETFANELLVSRPTVANDVLLLKKDIHKYGLTLIQKPNYGISIQGSEISKRKVLADWVFENLTQSDMFGDFLDAYFNSPDYQIIEIINQHQIIMSDISLIDFLICFSIAIARNTINHTIDSPIANFEQFKDRFEYATAKELGKYVQERFKIDFNEYEIQNITILLICKRSSRGLSASHDDNVITIANEILARIKAETLITFDTDKLFRILSLYIENTLIRQAYVEKIRTPVYENIQYEYPLPYHLASIASATIQQHSKIKLSRSELSAFTILFNNAINNQNKKKKKVLLINCMSGSTFTLHRYRIETELAAQLVITKYTQYYRINEEDLSNYDLIISSVPIRKQLSIPVINTSYMITNDDIIRIKSYLSYLFNDEDLVYYFHPYLYSSNVKVKSKKGVASTFYHLLTCLYPNLKDTFKYELNKQHRYTLNTFNNVIGLIKLNKPINANNNIVAITLNEPILFDQQQMQVIILFSCLDNNNIMYNTLFNTLKNVANNELDVKKLLSHLSYPEFLSVIKNNK